MHEISLPPQPHSPQGLAHPLAAAALSLAWVIGRVVYTLGYSQGLPQKRLPGAALRSRHLALLTGGVDSGLGVPAFRCCPATTPVQPVISCTSFPPALACAVISRLSYLGSFTSTACSLLPPRNNTFLFPLSQALPSQACPTWLPSSAPASRARAS